MSVQDDTSEYLADLQPRQLLLEHNWPDVFATPHAPVKAGIARRIVSSAVARLPIRIHFPDGTRMGAGRDERPVDGRSSTQ